MENGGRQPRLPRWQQWLHSEVDLADEAAATAFTEDAMREAIGVLSANLTSDPALIRAAMEDVDSRRLSFGLIGVSSVLAREVSRLSGAPVHQVLTSLARSLAHA